MKKILFTLLCAAFAFQSCSEEESQPQEVEFTIDYSFSSGDMTRVSNAEIYDSFYKNYIATRKLTPDRFELVFTNKETEQKNEVNGLWSENGLIRLVEGTYIVTGKSYEYNNWYAKDEALLAFNDEITIDKNTKSITVKALWDCPLLFFSTANTKSVTYRWGDALQIDEIKILDGYYYCFMKGVSSDNKSCFTIMRTNGESIKVYSDKLKLEKGKYYFFNDVTSGFDLEPMTPGN